ncbi:DnaJ domain-containing protein [Diplocarpon rosae]|nr:DnaJ domain-containing protein [Diplocarpon rosae]
MNSTLPPDPYKLLGVTKDSKLPEIRSAHRKLVLKCHPDKVQDATLKAIKQDEFQKVQQAYEILSDDNKRLQYDEQVKLFELRKEMGRGNPTPRSNPFEYEVKTAEPRPTSYGRPSPKVYSYQNAPRSNDESYEDPRQVPRKTASNDSASERKRAAEREESKKIREAREAALRKIEDERLRQKERDRETKRSHGEKKKSREKDRRRGTDEKVRTRQTYVEEDSSEDEYRAARASSERKQRHRMEDEARMREAAARADAEAARAERHAQEQRASIKEAPMTQKWDQHKEYAGAYMQAARRKGAAETESPVHPGMRRAETFSASSSPTYNIRYAAPQPQYSDEELPKRSSARKESSRRSPETPSAREKSSRRRSPPASLPNAPIIVEPPSPPSASRTETRKPSLHSYASAPPVFARESSPRAKTQDYTRAEASIPPLPRGQTFQSGDRGKERGSGGKLRKEYTSENEPESPQYHHASRPHSPSRRAAEPTTRYIVENGRTVPIVTRSLRSDMRNLDPEYPHERSESIRGSQATRPPMTRASPSSERPHPSTRSYSTNYETTEPIVLTARPKLSREGSSSHRSSSRGATQGAYFDNVKYATSYKPEHVVYSPAAGGIYESVRRGNDRSARDYHTSYQHQPRPVYG